MFIKGVVKARREAINVYYKLADDRITKACDIMREVLISRLKNDPLVHFDGFAFLCPFQASAKN